MVAMVADRGDGIKEMLDNGRNLNPITDEMTKKAAELKDKQIELGVQMSKTSTVMVTEAMPALLSIATAMAEAAQDGGTLTAIWVGLGGVGNTLFGPAIQAVDKAMMSATATIDEYMAKGEELLSHATFGKIADMHIAEAARLSAAAASLRAQIAAMDAPPPAPPAPHVDTAAEIAKKAADAAEAQRKMIAMRPKVTTDAASDPWVQFNDGLDRMVQKAGQGEYAMLRLENVQKAAGNATEIATGAAKIDAIQRQASAKVVNRGPPASSNLNRTPTPTRPS